MAKYKALNNLLHYYKESGFGSLKMFAEHYELSYNTLTEQIRKDVDPTDSTIKGWCMKLELERTYFDQDREPLSYEDLDYWHHNSEKYTIDEFFDAAMKVSEDFDLDREKLFEALSHHEMPKKSPK